MLSRTEIDSIYETKVKKKNKESFYYKVGGFFMKTKFICLLLVVLITLSTQTSFS